MMETEYELIEGDADEIAGLVNEMLTGGWELYGSPIFHGGYFYQAVTRKLEEKRKPWIGVAVIGGGKSEIIK